MRYTNEEYQFLLDAYTGNGGFKDGSYLIRHPRETDEKYQIRKKLAYYPNFVKKIVEVSISHIFKKPISRESDRQEINQFWNNADGNGSYIDSVMRRYAKFATVLGTVFLIVDRKPIQAMTRADELSNLPYIVVRLPSAVVDYSIDQNGNLEWIVFSESITSKRFREYGVRVDKIFRYFDKENFVIFQGSSIESAVEISKGQHNLGIVPVVPLTVSDLDLNDIFADSKIFEIAKINHRIYNALSELDEILRNQTFPILTLPVSNVALDRKQYDNLILSTENAILYDPSSGGKPDFIAPPTGPTEAYERRIELMIDYIYRLASFEFTGGVSKSGVAMAFDFQETNRTLANIARSIEDAEEKIVDIIGRWFDIDVRKTVVEYPKDFSVLDFQQEVKNAIDLLSLDISKKFNVELKKKLVFTTLGDRLSESELQEIYDEIESQEDFMFENRMRKEGLGLDGMAND